MYNAGLCKITVGKFVCMFAPIPPAKFSLWESTYEKVCRLIDSDRWHNYVLERAKQYLETKCERGLGQQWSSTRQLFQINNGHSDNDTFHINHDKFPLYLWWLTI